MAFMVGPGREQLPAHRAVLTARCVYIYVCIGCGNPLNPPPPPLPISPTQPPTNKPQRQNKKKPGRTTSRPCSARGACASRRRGSSRYVLIHVVFVYIQIRSTARTIFFPQADNTPAPNPHLHTPPTYNHAGGERERPDGEADAGVGLHQPGGRWVVDWLMYVRGCGDVSIHSVSLFLPMASIHTHAHRLTPPITPPPRRPRALVSLIRITQPPHHHA